MAKGVKKNNRKLRRQIRKTFGALFMISALVVATLPVQEVSANPTDPATIDVKVAVVDAHSVDPIKNATKPYTSTIPYAQDRPDDVEGRAEKIVYTSGDGTFQFVYMRPTLATPNKVAVILGYNSGVLQESSLTIPDTLEAYKKYTDNTSRSGYCLVSKNDSFLYYESNEQMKDSSGYLRYNVPGIIDPSTSTYLVVNQYDTRIQEDANGNMVYVRQEVTGQDADGNDIFEDKSYTMVPIMDTVYYPCYYEQRSNWQDVADTDLFYLQTKANSTDPDVYVQAGNNNDYWKINADVAYIGGEKIKDNGTGGWELDGFIDEPSEGVFAGQNNITNLTIGNNLLGISDYAFYSCATLQSVSLANGLQCIGNGAFADCIRLQNCSIADNANIKAIGKDAFYNCRTLSSFISPIGLQALGDNCFEGCSSMTDIDLCSGGGAVALATLGNNLFKGCNKLSHVIFPDNYTESDLSINMFDGCTSLQYVQIPNADITFTETAVETGNGQGFAEFISTVPSTFYFEGPGTSNIHDTATAESIAFKYLGQDLYEKIINEKDAGNNDVKVTYQVNSTNELVKFWIEAGKKPINVTIPETIGPYGIASIGAGSFNDNCDLTKITIPASVHTIGDNAFKGCHELKTVIFTDANTLQSIGTDAFKTQDATCTHVDITPTGDSASDPNIESKNPELTFVGAMYNTATGIDTVPFVYAMNGVSNINNGNQEISWINCHSGWPTNIEVKYQYNPVTAWGEAELQNYPKYSDLTTGLDAWLADLPYLKDDPNKISEYKSIVQNAFTNYDNYNNGTSTTQPTQNELDIINSALNIVVPNSVDSIKEGIFSGVKVDGSPCDPAIPSTPNDKLETIVLNGVKEIEPYTFKNCTGLKEAAIIEPTYIGDYAFDGDTGLTNVTLGTNLQDTGLRPFRGCEKLSTITCLGSNFSYGDGLLVRNSGTDVELVECLENRGKTQGSYTVGPDELSALTAIKPEAFENCKDIGKVDLSTSSIKIVPERCFAGTDDLTTVALPNSTESVEADSFINSGLRVLTIPASVTYLEKDAFVSTPQQTITFECVEGSAADRYAKQPVNSYINPEYGKIFLTHIVYFWDDLLDQTNPVLIDRQVINDGADAVPPTAPMHDGYTFTGWSNYSNISRDTDVYAKYSPVGAAVYTVTFVDYDGTTIGTPQQVETGKSAIPPTDPVRDGYTFTGWAPDYNNITQNSIIIAQYADNSGSVNRHTVTFYGYDGKTVVVEQKVDDGAAAVAPAAPVRSGYTFIGWVPADFSNVTKDMSVVASYEKTPATNGSGSGSGSGSSNATPTPTPTPTSSSQGSGSSTAKTYTVSVNGGSGSGSYEAGRVVAINAFDKGVGQNFDRWTTSTAGVGFADANAASTNFVMPANNVAITATYKTGGSTSGGTGTSGGGGGNTGGGTNYNTNNSGTSVQVTRPGISNTNLAGATVSGSTDDFIVKVTEDQAATDAAITALQSKYGDISRIKYAAMDISLYDSTGRTKIADTSGMSVNLTLPIPDSLVEYAGNNQVASVAGGNMEDLSTRLTTVDGVACVNFMAPHLSPYVIYVDTANLVQGTVDVTPQTGDPIHPKWFLSIGLACVAMILFFKRDKVLINTKVA